MSIYWLAIIPFLLWFSGLLFANDLLNSRGFFYLLFATDILCLAAGIVLFRYQVFPEKRGFFVVVFAVPIIFLTCFELLRMIFKAWRYENPCISVRTGRRSGDPPVNGFFTKYPPTKLISWTDRLFGISQMFVPMIIVFVLFICSLAMNW